MKATKTAAILKAHIAKSKRDVHHNTFEFTWRVCAGPPLLAEYRPIPGRNFQSDYAHEASRTLIELDGGIWFKGGHTSGSGKERDCEKDFLAFLEGWRTVRLVPSMINMRRIGQLIWLLKGGAKP